MSQSDELAAWAASFISLQAMEAEVIIPDNKGCTEQAKAQSETKVTAAALLLLDAVNRGGIPAFMTSNLKQMYSVFSNCIQ